MLVVFWLTSCGICRHELPLLDRLRADFSGVEILAVNIRDIDGAREFMSSERLRLTNLIDPDGQIRRSAPGWQDERTLREWRADAGA